MKPVADINTLFELVKELNRGGVLVRWRGDTKLHTSPRLLSVEKSLLPKAVMRGLLMPTEAWSLTVGGGDWLHQEKNKLRRKKRAL